MTHENNYSEFKGTTKEAIRDIREDISALKEEVQVLNKKVWILVIALSILAIDRLPSLVGLVLAR